jgi:hypothetical protein
LRFDVPPGGSKGADFNLQSDANAK